MTGRQMKPPVHASRMHQNLSHHIDDQGITAPVHITPQHQGIKLDISDVETELRRDYLHNYYVIISPNRARRPFDTTTEERHLVETLHSPKLDDQPSVFSIDDDHHNWLVKVVSNKYPSLTPMNPQAYGMQEIIIDTPLSNRALASLSTQQISKVLAAFSARIASLSKQDAIEYVIGFHNDGYSAGASLAHAHSQIMALPLVPPKIQAEANSVEDYFTEKKSDPYEDIINYEQSADKRIIEETDNFISFCPFAPRWPFEVWIMPKRAAVSITEFYADELNTLANMLKNVIGKLCRHNLSYNFYLEEGVSPHHRFVLKICGRTGIWGGFEVGTDIIINSVAPESAAKWYRDSK